MEGDGVAALRVALVEDDATTRWHLAGALAGVPGMLVVGVHASGEDALDWMKAAGDGGADLVDVMVVDVELPGMTGIDVVERLAVVVPSLRFLMLTLHEDRHWIFNALRAGASGYVAKGCAVEALVAAIREVHGGGMPFSIGVARRVSEHFRALPPSAPEEDRLSPREVDVLGGLARGRLLKEVAADLGVSEHTVKTYLKRIYAKLKVRSSRAAVARFLGR